MSEEETPPIHRGLEDVTVAETALSRIDGAAGELLIRGIPVGELAPNATYEEAAFFVLHDRLPTPAEYETVRDDLAANRDICDETRALLRRAAREEVPPMDALRMGTASSTLGWSDSEDASAVRRVVAVLPTIVATYWRYREGREPVAPREDLRHAANYLYMLTGTEPSDATVRGLETYLNTVIDHGMNASTFTARVVVSSESDVVSAVTAAIGTLKGPLHGGAPGPVLDALETVHESGDPASYVRAKLDAGERLMGFGHRVYRNRDPRADVLSEAAERFYENSSDEDFFKTATAYEEVALDLLADHKPDRRLETNVEFYTAVLLHGIGVPRELFTPTFAIARVSGWTAHCLEQREDNRIIRPRARYTGATSQTWIPMEER